MRKVSKGWKLTPEQIEFRKSIIRKRKQKTSSIITAAVIKKPAPTIAIVNAPVIQKKITRNEYMNNCMFWINECNAGRENRKRLLKSVRHLRDYCNEIIKENTPAEPKKEVAEIDNPFEFL